MYCLRLAWLIWSLINTSQCIEFNLLTIDFDLTWLQQVGNFKNIVTGWSQNWWCLLSASIWYQSLGWWGRWFNVSCNLFLTRMFHHLVEPFDSMNYHWFGQRKFSNWVEQDLPYSNRWCHQHRHLFVSWPSCLKKTTCRASSCLSCCCKPQIKCECNSMDFDPNVKFQVSWDNAQYIPKRDHHNDQSIIDPRNTLHLLSC